MEESGELQIEDKGNEAEGFESPQAPERDVAKGSEEMPKGTQRPLSLRCLSPHHLRKFPPLRNPPKDLRQKLK